MMRSQKNVVSNEEVQAKRLIRKINEDLEAIEASLTQLYDVAERFKTTVPEIQVFSRLADQLVEGKRSLEYLREQADNLIREVNLLEAEPLFRAESPAMIFAPATER